MSPINRKLISFLSLATFLQLVDGLCIITTSSDSIDSTRSPQEAIDKNVSGSIVYTKLRHDRNNLQVFRKYQLLKTHEEKPKQLRLIETIDNSSNKETTYSYYENAAIEESSITQDDLILEALDRTYKTRLIPVYIHNYDNPKDRASSSDPSVISSSRCNRDLDYLMKQLDLLEEAHRRRQNLSIAPEMAAFFDSFAGEEPGLLFGNYHWTGNWRQCYKRLIFDLDRSNPSKTIAFRGRYCTVSIRSSSWGHRIKEKTAQLLDNYFKYPEQRYDYARFFRIQVGLCLPESCDSRAIDSRRSDIKRLGLYKLNEPFKSYDLLDLYCLPDETSELRQIEPMGWILIAVSLLWCSMILMATYFDYTSASGKDKIEKQAVPKGITKADPPAIKQQRSKSEKIICSLSLIKNFHRLTETESLTGRVPAANKKTATGLPEEAVSPRIQAPNDLLFLNAYKVISMPLIIYGHIGMLSVHLNRFPLDYESFDNEALFHFSSSSVFFVDWYFVTTGFLTSYIMFVTKKVERNKTIDWIYSIFHRYWRLAPLYILLFWFNKYLFQHLSYGPIWDYGTSNMTIRSICRRESWLYPVFLVSNFHPIHEECIMPAWYIANDMQFYMITPIILLGLLNLPKTTWIATLGAIGASILARVHRYLTDPRVQPIELMRPGFDLYMRNNWDVHATYIYPHYRIPSHLIGLLAGHYAYKVIKGDWKSPFYCADRMLAKKSSPSANRSRLMGTSMWLIGFQIVLSMAFATWPIKEYFPRSLEPQVEYFVAGIYGFCHSTTAFGMALMFLGLIFGHLPGIRKFLTLPFWTLVSRVNYIVFLVQVEVIYWVYQSSERVPDFSNREAFKYWLQLVFLCYSISTMLTLWIELPLAYLEREFIGSWMASRSKAKTTQVKAHEQRLRGAKKTRDQCEMITKSESTHLVGELDHHRPTQKSPK